MEGRRGGGGEAIISGRRAARTTGSSALGPRVQSVHYTAATPEKVFQFPRALGLRTPPPPHPPPTRKRGRRGPLGAGGRTGASPLYIDASVIERHEFLFFGTERRWEWIKMETDALTLKGGCQKRSEEGGNKERMSKQTENKGFHNGKRKKRPPCR
jgi:hypothetical protein